MDIKGEIVAKKKYWTEIMSPEDCKILCRIILKILNRDSDITNLMIINAVDGDKKLIDNLIKRITKFNRNRI